MALRSAKLEGKILTIEMDVDALRDSSSGKSEIVSSSGGPTETDVIIDGRPVYVVASAYVKKPKMKAKMDKTIKQMAEQVI